MNRAKLDALLRAGLISTAQHAAAVHALASGASLTLPTLELELPVAQVTLRVEDDAADENEPASGTIEADITRYGELIPSHGMILHPGSLTTRQPLDRVKMLRDHNMSDPVGYMLAVDDAVEHASFRIAPRELERVSEEIEHKLRDGVSIGFQIFEYDIDDEWILHVHRGEIHEVSLVAIPAVASAGVTNVAAALATARKEDRTMNRAQLAAALAAGQINQEQYDAAIAALDALATNGPARPAAPEVADGPELQTEQPPNPAARVVERLSLRDVNRRLAEAANSGDIAGFTLALADVIPADDAGQAFMREDWEGEAWRLDDSTRPWIDAFGAPAELNSLKGKGWQWGTADENGDGGEPLVDEYAGNKTEVPTNEIGTEPKSYTAFRIAAGWDVDRAFEDFADAEFWAAFWPAVMRDYKRKSDAGIRTRTIAAATDLTPTAYTNVKAALKEVVKSVRPYGKVNRIFLGDQIFEELEDLDTEALPLWLKNAVLGLDIAEGTADIGTLRILNDGTLDPRQVVAFDNRAAKVRERAPFRLQALNIGRAGIDVGVYSYLRLDDYENRAIVSKVYTAGN